ncbi:MAG TPA: DedA family protein [Candidatus Pullichristensenella avicola]|nr:DedA family protein [Candidatus Pullichristensenella avicola]
MIAIMSAYGYLGVFFLIFVENVFPPIPSEVVLLFGGAMTAHPDLNLSVPVVIFAATCGSVAGAIVLYLLGRILKAERLRKLFEGRFGRILRLKPEDVDKATAWFVKYEKKAVLICRCVPIVRSLISIPAGIAEMNVPLFLLLTTLGSAVWNTILVCVGAFLGERWSAALPFFEKYSDVILVIAIIAVAVFLVWWFGFRNRRKKTGAEAQK